MNKKKKIQSSILNFSNFFFFFWKIDIKGEKVDSIDHCVQQIYELNLKIDLITLT